MKLSKTFSLLIVGMLFAIWIYSFFFIPTFDLDESLYRRVAEEMKWNGDFWHAVWDGKPLHHKPPLFYWMIVFFSRIFDGADAGVSILAARLPSFLATLGIIFSLSAFQKKPGENYFFILSTSFLLWGCTLFPVFTSTAVLFDPLQTLMLIPSLLIPHRAFSEIRSIRKNEYIIIGLSMFAASALKGLTGLILPSLAITIHTLIHHHKTAIKEIFRFIGFAFIPASLLTLIFYFYLDQKIGRTFTEEFFLVHHLGRGTQAMEAHRGPFYYYIGIILVGGGLLIPLLAQESIRTQFNYKKLGFPLSFALGILIFFSASATKLPHYTWPIWPALLLQCLTLRSQPTSNKVGSHSTLWKIFLIPILILSFVLFWFIFHPEVIRQTEINNSETLLLSAAASLCIIVVFCFKKWLHQMELIAATMILITFLIAIPLSSIAGRILVDPFFEAAHALKAFSPTPQDCIRDSGPTSATLSLALGKELGREFVHNRCEPGNMKYLISPVSKKAECIENKMSVILEGKTLILCRRI